ncbi:hypothetical protein BDY19DRAFT_910132 [Irpex rosettiformis]|uniref:Uncharacterized protein n=1 Tax=Irpex rosettiformis TaxID=378272 RepID=A0ACB8TQ14_9APHY|nr:hypothetical protein BDY19DRAFT_910132 [Irpex rosettiformis]
MLSFIRFALIALFATTVIAMPSATPTKRMTNAQRMARGLPPNAPHRRISALKARHSAVPPANPGNYPGNHPRDCTPRDGIIQVISSTDNSTLGYVSKNHSGQGKYGLCSDSKDALKVHANCDGDNWDMPITDGDHPDGCDHFGGVVGDHSAGSDFVGGNSNHAVCTGVASTPGGSFASVALSIIGKLTGRQTSTQSSIWSLNDDTRDLTAGWVNHSGERASTFFSYVKEADTLFTHGDPSAFAASVSPQVSVEVNLKLADCP